MKFIGKTLIIIVLFNLTFTLSGCRKKTTEGEEGSETRVIREEIVWWHLFDPSDTFKGQIQEFQSMNNKYRITIKTFNNAEIYEKMLLNEMAAGGGPDIFSIKNTNVITHKRKISPMPRHLMVPEMFRDTFFAVASDDLILKDEQQQEQIYALPLYIDTLGLYYNKKLFISGLPSTDKPADNWEEIKEQVYGLTKTDNSIERFAVSGLAAGRSDNIIRAIDILQLLFIQHQIKMTDEREQKATFANQQGTLEGTGQAYFPGEEALKLYTSFGLPSYKNYTWNQLITSMAGDPKEVGVFAKGKVAMIFGYSWLYQDILKEAQKDNYANLSENDIGVVEVPQLVSPSKSGLKHALASYHGLTVSKNSKNPDAAWELINFITQPESLQDYYQKTNKPTPRKDMVEEQSKEKIFGVFALQASYAKSIRTYNENDFNTIFSEAIDTVVKSRGDARSVITLAQERMNCVLEKYKDPTKEVDCTKIKQ